MTVNVIDRKCKTCAFYEDVLQECRRKAPRTTNAAYPRPGSKWPKVTASQWCGEWKSKQ